MKVLSLFDGISCARVALDRAGIAVESYSASEVDPKAIQITQKHWPETIQLGDVREVHIPAGQIDLLIGGSPCTDLSIAKAGRQGLDGEHSSLFWEYARVLHETKPRWFILENVASMPKKDKDIITQELGVEPVLFDAALVSAQTRKRLFWTNIKFDLPPDRGIMLKDILQPDAEVDESMFIKNTSFCLTTEKAEKAKGKNKFIQIGYVGADNESKVGGQALRIYSNEGKSTTSGVGLYQINCTGAAIRGRPDEDGKWVNTLQVRDDGKANALTNSYAAKLALVKLGHVGNTDSQANRIYSPEGKSVTLSALGGGGGAKTGLYMCGYKELRRLDENGVRHDGDTQYPLVKRYEFNDSGKANTLTTMTNDKIVVATPEMRIRKLTPIECERLQGLPDNYTEGVAKTHRYKCIGNAFNVDVVAHILTHLPH